MPRASMHTPNLYQSEWRSNNMEKIYNLIRKNIRELSPYSTARDDCKEKMEIYLDANENPFNNGINRYPSPFQEELKKLVATIKKSKPENIFLGNGSDEAIDLIFRIFCTPGKESALVVSPSYGMYKVAAKINDVELLESMLDENFQLKAESVLKDVKPDTKVIFICSPNNPSGNMLEKEEIEKIIENFNGIVVIDEAYIDFADSEGFATAIERYPNLIVLQTLSKAWGMAGIRIGIAIAQKFIVETFNKVKYPYNISVANQEKAIEVLKNSILTIERIELIKSERKRVKRELERLPQVVKVYKSDANFLLVKFKEKEAIFKKLQQKGIIVRDRSSVALCRDCLRITIGTPQENDSLINAISEERCPIGRPLQQTGAERIGECIRNTRETSVQVSLNLDRFSQPFISTGLNFFNHMLEQIAYHGGIGVKIICAGDLATDDHHTVEDTAIAIGKALAQAVGEKKGIERYGFSLPMDEAQATVLIDLGGRAELIWDVKFASEKIGDVNSQMFGHFFKSFAENARCNLHIKASGENDHHIIEGVFKAFARALKCAIRKDQYGYGIASSKGSI